ncbi:MAG: hypothetical protein ABIW76_08405 [Fibrobacteria bacterium]
MMLGFLFALLATRTAYPQWTQVNSGPGGNTPQVLAVEGGNLWSGTEMDGLFRSVDSGLTWSKISGMTEWGINEFLPFGGNLFVGSRFGLFRSRDAGISWSQLPLIPGVWITCLAAESGKIFASGGAGPLMLSADSGNTWSQLDAATSGFRTIARNENILFAGGSNGAMLSTDSGKTWRPTGEPLEKNIISLLVNGGQVFAGTSYEGVYRTADNGRNWVHASMGLGSESGAITALAAQGNALFAATASGGILRSLDRGVTWTSAQGNMPLGPLESLGILGRFLFAGTYGAGIFRSADSGKTWIQANRGLPQATVTAWLEIGDTCLAGSYSGGAYRSLDRGSTWSPVSYGLPFSLFGPYFRPLLEDRGMAWAALNRGLARSSDRGASWTPVTKGISTGIVQAMARTESGVLYAGASGDNDAGPWQGGIFRSLDKGNSWTQANQGIEGKPVNAMAVKAESLFIGTAYGFYRSGDSGKTWIPMNGGLSDSAANDLAWFEGSMLAATRSGIFRADGNGNWSLFEPGAPESDIRVLEVVGGQIYAASRTGSVFRLHAAGGAWLTISDGLPLEPEVVPTINSIGKCGDHLMVGGQRQIWRRLLSQTVGITSTPRRGSSDPVLARGPGGRLVVFRLPVPGLVDLRVWDLSGRMHSLLFRGLMPAGRHQIPVPKSREHGIRILRLRAGERVSTLRIPFE